MRSWKFWICKEFRSTLITPILPLKFKMHGKMIWNFNYSNSGKNTKFFIDEGAYSFTSNTSLGDPHFMIEEFALHLSTIVCTPMALALQRYWMGLSNLGLKHPYYAEFPQYEISHLKPSCLNFGVKVSGYAALISHNSELWVTLIFLKEVKLSFLWNEILVRVVILPP